MDVNKILNSMTLKEKIGQLCLSGSHKEKVMEGIKNGSYGSVLNHQGKDHVNNLQQLALKTNQKIPLLIGDDVIHGYRSIFPVPVGIACSFNLDLIENLVRMSTEEASIAGVNWIYSPMLDVTHDPRWGRIMETAGEDPMYSSLVGRSFVRGIQHPLKDGRITAACAKHYIGYGAVEAGIDYNTTDYSLYRLHNLYLPTFKKAIDEGVYSVMNAFTTFNGEAVTGSNYLLRELLRDKLGFDGVLVTDWECINQLPKHKMVENNLEASKHALKLGIDIDMQSDCYLENLEKLVLEDPSLEKYIDESVIRVLKMKEKMGLFEHPYVLENAYEMLSEDNRALCLEAAEESIILFKNEDVLPIKKVEKTLIIGPYVDEQDSHLGAWCCKGQASDVVSIKEAFKKLDNISYYPTKFDFSDLDYNKLEEEITKVDKIIITLGEPRLMSGENNNRMRLNLPFNQEKTIDYLQKFKKPLIALVIAGRSLGLQSVHEKVNALVFSFQLGIEAGNAYRNILMGYKNPSGKTVVTFPKELGQVPIYYNHFTTGRSELMNYVDGDLEPLYPFGYGLHYGKLESKVLNVSLKEKLNVEVELTNLSDFDITETVQVYLSIPYYHYLRPIKEFIGFKKIEVKANKTVKDTIEINLHKMLPNDLSNGIKLTIGVGNSSAKLEEIIIEYHK